MKEQYSWTENKTDEIWYHDKFDSIEECIADAILEGKEPGEKIVIGICEDYVPYLDVDTLLDRVCEDAYETVGEVAEGWPEFKSHKGYVGSEKLQEKLDKVFNEWLKETNQVPQFYHIKPLEKEYVIPEKKGGKINVND